MAEIQYICSILNLSLDSSLLVNILYFDLQWHPVQSKDLSFGLSSSKFLAFVIARKLRRHSKFHNKCSASITGQNIRLLGAFTFKGENLKLSFFWVMIFNKFCHKSLIARPHKISSVWCMQHLESFSTTIFSVSSMITTLSNKNPSSS